jgi:tetratricopeptide (TPR) repeat protein
MTSRISSCVVALFITLSVVPLCAAGPVAAQSAEEVFRQVSPSVLIVEAIDRAGSVVAFGSGIAIAPDRIITNKHVSDEGLNIQVRQGRNTWKASIARQNPEQDLCELWVEGLKASAATLRSSSTLTVGERVYAVGSPRGLELTITGGIISGIRQINQDRIIQTDASISPGSSGGGLFDASGRLVGITTFSLAAAQNLNFAVPVDWLIQTSQATGMIPKANTRTADASPIGLLQRGFKAEAAKDYVKAADQYREAVRRYPDFDFAWFALGWANSLLGNQADAILAYHKAIEIQPTFAPYWSNLCLSLVQANHNEAAVNACSTATSLDRTLAPAWGLLGMAQHALGQHESAVSSLTEAIRLKPETFVYWARLGRAQLALRRFDDGLRSTQEALRLDQRDADVWWQLGIAHFMLDQNDEAVEAFKKAISIKPDHVDSWYYLGAIYSIQGKRSNVIDVYQTLRRLDPQMADKFFNELVIPSSGVKH